MLQPRSGYVNTYSVATGLTCDVSLRSSRRNKQKETRRKEPRRKLQQKTRPMTRSMMLPTHPAIPVMPLRAMMNSQLMPPMTRLKLTTSCLRTRRMTLRHQFAPRKSVHSPSSRARNRLHPPSMHRLKPRRFTASRPSASRN